MRKTGLDPGGFTVCAQPSANYLETKSLEGDTSK